MSKVAVITGAASGFGFELSKSLHNKGWIVYGADKNKTALKSLEALGIKTLVMDVTSDTQVKNGINKVIKNEERIDLVVANAGYGGFAGIEDLSHEAVRQMFEVNVFGVDRTATDAQAAQRKNYHHCKRGCSRFTCRPRLVCGDETRGRGNGKCTTPRSKTIRYQSFCH
jgi:NAD(P)-dependent dehydrogenase (short-subunit alcohol dehydrogenase family)